MRTLRPALLAIVGIFACATAIWAEGTTQLSDRLHHAEQLNSIDDPSLKPWHLKVTFQMFDVKGKPSEQGTIEEWWLSPSAYKIVYTSPSYTSTEVKTADGLYRTKGLPSPPFLLDLALKGIVHAISQEDIDESTPDLRRESFGKVSLDCIMLSQPIKHDPHPPLGLFPTYCFDRDTNSLRVNSSFGNQMTIRNSIGTFQERVVPLTQFITIGSVNVLSTHVEELRGEPLTNANFTLTGDLENIDSHPVQIGSGVMAGRIQNRVDPVYPESARANHVSGTVIIRARIGTDGRIHSIKLASTSDPDLAIAAIAAVRQWTYKPYTLNGVPTEVLTTITVNFKIGP